MAMKFRDIDDSQAPLLDHLIELRQRLLKCVYALVITFAICMFFSDRIFVILVHPLVEAGQSRLIYTKLYDAFFVNVKVSLFAAFLISFPVIANQLWAFVAPGLYSREKKALLPFLIATPILFTMGASLAYFVMMPIAFRWFLGFQGAKGGLQVEALPNAADYLNLVMHFILAFGISFLLPVLLMLLNRAGIVSRAQLVRARRYVVVGCFALAAVAAPPDLGSMLMLAVPLVLLFEGTLVVMRFIENKEAEQRDAVEAAKPVPDPATLLPESPPAP